jgi:hypothetical protein
MEPSAQGLKKLFFPQIPTEEFEGCSDESGQGSAA